MMNGTSGSVTVRDSGPRSAVNVVLDDASTRNALSPETVQSLYDTVTRAVMQSRPALVISSASFVFASGADLRDLDDSDDSVIRDRFRDIQSLLEVLEFAPLVTIAIIDGPAIGAGADLAMACDHRLGGASSEFRFPGAQFGLLLGTRRLAQVSSPALAQYLALTGSPIRAQRAYESGLLTDLLKEDELRTVASELADAAERTSVDTTSLVRATRYAASCETDREFLESSMREGIANRMRAFREGQMHERS